MLSLQSAKAQTFPWLQYLHPIGVGVVVLGLVLGALLPNLEGLDVGTATLLGSSEGDSVEPLVVYSY